MNDGQCVEHDTESLLNCIGNLVPLEAVKNRLASKKSFEDKKVIYQRVNSNTGEKETKFVTCREIWEETEWTPEKIRNRKETICKALCDKLVPGVENTDDCKMFSAHYLRNDGDPDEDETKKRKSSTMGSESAAENPNPAAKKKKMSPRAPKSPAPKKRERTPNSPAQVAPPKKKGRKPKTPVHHTIEDDEQDGSSDQDDDGQEGSSDQDDADAPSAMITKSPTQKATPVKKKRWTRAWASEENSTRGAESDTREKRATPRAQEHRNTGKEKAGEKAFQDQRSRD